MSVEEVRVCVCGGGGGCRGGGGYFGVGYNGRAGVFPAAPHINVSTCICTLINPDKRHVKPARSDH